MRTTTRIAAGIGLLAVMAFGSGCKRRPAALKIENTSPTAPGSPGPSGIGNPQKMTGAQAEAQLGAASAEARKPNRDCKLVLQQVFTALSFVEAPTPTVREALYAAARCSEATNNANAMLRAGALLARLDPQTEKHAFVPRAYMGLGKLKEAAETLVAANRRFPNQPEILFTGASVAVAGKAWPAALKGADATVRAVRASKDPEIKPLGYRAQILKATAHVMSGDLAGAEKDIAAAQIDGAPAPVIDGLKRSLVPMKLTKLGVSPRVPDAVYLGTYHLFGKAEIGDLFSVTLSNLAPKDQVYKVEMEIPGVTDKVSKTVTLLKGKSDEIRLTPPFKADFTPASQRAERGAHIAIKITQVDTDKVVFDQTYATKIFPRDQVPAALYDWDVVGAWITPQAHIVEEFMKDAKKRHPKRTLSGSFDPTIEQVKALYEELKARGMSYVLVTNFGAGAAQHVRLPAESIKSTNALCIDGAVLFATLLEKLGLKPLIVLVPGHAFVGWKAEAADRQAPGTNYFLETTMVGTASFDDAMAAANEQVMRAKKLGHFETGTARVLDVLALRQRGITPQPWE